MLAPVALLLAAAGAVALAPAASAHDELVATAPEAGASLAAPPAEVVLTFSEQVESLGAAVVVTDSTGARVAEGAPSVSGTAVTQQLAAEVAAGEVTVAYRIVSSDGHPVSGRYVFTLIAPATAPAGSPGPPVPVTPSASVPTSNAGATPSTAPAAALDSSGGLPGLAAAGGVVLVVAVGAAVALGLRARGGSSS